MRSFLETGEERGYRAKLESSKDLGLCCGAEGLWGEGFFDLASCLAHTHTASERSWSFSDVCTGDQWHH